MSGPGTDQIMVLKQRLKRTVGEKEFADSFVIGYLTAHLYLRYLVGIRQSTAPAFQGRRYLSGSILVYRYLA